MSTPDPSGAGMLGRLGHGYERLYEQLCGAPPGPLRPLHSKWLATVDLHRDLRDVLGAIEGRVLDVGCGEQPYREWLGEGCDYTGMDVDEGAGVAIVIRPGEPWPLPEASYDAVICTQVLEHDSRPEHTLSEIDRVLRPGGVAVITVPFAYNEHAMPHDYRRFSAIGASAAIGGRLTTVEVRKQGLIGSLLGILWLNWIDLAVGRSRALQVARALLLPFWILYCALVNLACRLLDRLDPTGAFYSNVMVVARKRKANEL
jgi:SAM-dependent methyltransferase